MTTAAVAMTPQSRSADGSGTGIVNWWAMYDGLGTEA
jgi:hypothetical protein